ncbi:MAG TPA: hypothetical protein VJO13_19300 [Ktedonobacterales bacterium]|nr:hypothetical protein [Ktedonobacterales bacterium]
MRVRLTQLDGVLPNLALMKLSAHHRDHGDEVTFSRSPYRSMLESDYDRVYGSAIFDFSAKRVEVLRREFPGAIVGGTWNRDEPLTVETLLGVEESERYDYSLHPDFMPSIGFTARGCRLKCGFCVVPKKEGAPRSVNTIASIWRGEPWPKHLMLLDNDFFGQPREQWEARVREMIDGGFKVCLSQGVNIRMIDDGSATALASLHYCDDSFKSRRLYTAWDNIGDEKRFFAGVDCLERHGIPPHHLMVYMLVGYDRRETWERVMYRFDRMVARGIRPFPMIYGDRHRTLPLGGSNLRIGHKPLWQFQKWAIRRYYELLPFDAFDNNAKGGATGQSDLFAEAAA